MPRSSLRYAPVARPGRGALARRIEELAGAHPRFGYRRIWALLVREGWSVNKKAVRRIWRLSGLKLARPQAHPRPRRPHGQDANACGSDAKGSVSWRGFTSPFRSLIIVVPRSTRCKENDH